ncbi:MAG: putative toxin-antitoxin system toxin component, PIN family [Candidatus Firestonebacteria bacterium]|nr:putative toxin-antitoxin system toxin component, PIN family [Candidatus Firestonebacteria bacterium]
MSIKVVLDTNIYISALLVPGSNPDKIIHLAINKFLEIYISPEILKELENNLVKKFEYTDKEAKEVIIWLESIARIIKPVHSIANVCKKDSDHCILECAMSGGADFIVSGDKKHLLSIKKYSNIEIISPAEFLKKIMNDNA